MEIDTEFMEWTDLCALVASNTSFEGFQRWAFIVGTDGTPAERLHRGRMTWARWGVAGPIEGRAPQSAVSTA